MTSAEHTEHIDGDTALAERPAPAEVAEAPVPRRGRLHPDRHRPDLAWRALVAVAAIVTALVGAPTYVVGLLVAAALVLGVERLARSRGEGVADSLLVGVGGLVVVLVLAGLVLGSTPIGLTSTTWAVGLGLVALGALGVADLLPRPAYVDRATWLAGAKALPWAVAVIAVASIAIGISVRSIAPAEAQPLQMSFGAVKGTQVQVVVSSSERSGPLELRTTQGGNEISYPLFQLGADGTYRTTLAVPAQGRFEITLNNPDQTKPLRSLILDR